MDQSGSIYPLIAASGRSTTLNEHAVPTHTTRNRKKQVRPIGGWRLRPLKVLARNCVLLEDAFDDLTAPDRRRSNNDYCKSVQRPTNINYSAGAFERAWAEEQAVQDRFLDLRRMIETAGCVGDLVDLFNPGESR
jgi:hypothetical protein